MNYRTISAGEVIAKIYRDLGSTIGFDNWEQDAFEWIGEALEHIGAGVQLEKKSDVLTIASFKAVLPTDLVQLIDVFYAPSIDAESEFPDAVKYPLRMSGATVHQGIHTDLRGDEPIFHGESYQLNPDYIHTSLETGFVGITYLALPVDANGFPLVPADISYREAMFWYILKKLFMRGWKHPEPNFSYFTAEQKWQYYCTQARNQSNMPDLAGYDLFLRTWRHLTPEPLARDTFFDRHDVRNPDWTYGNESF
jgi:hypothetical protein